MCIWQKSHFPIKILADYLKIEKFVIYRNFIINVTNIKHDVCYKAIYLKKNTL